MATNKEGGGGGMGSRLCPIKAQYRTAGGQQTTPAHDGHDGSLQPRCGGQSEPGLALTAREQPFCKGADSAKGGAGTYSRLAD